jgi:hypothetical protein
MKKYIALLIVTIFNPANVFAQADKFGLKTTGQKAFGASSPVVSSNQTIYTLIGQFISILLGTLGVVFLIIVVYAGIQWMLAGGDDSKVTESRKLLTNAVIGLAIVLGAYAISIFVIESLINVFKATT